MDNVNTVIAVNGFCSFLKYEPLRLEANVPSHSDDRAIIVSSAIVEITGQHDQHPRMEIMASK